MLKSHGLRVPEGIVCTAGEAVGAAEKLGFPVTLKVSSDAIAHKTEAGGVALNLRTAAEVKAAAERMAKLAPDVLVERMVTGAVAELIIGLKADPQFGAALVVGAGGILTELLKDSVTLILPTSRAEIERALKSLKVWKLVEGFRGKSGDQHAVIKAVEAVAAFADANRGRIEELDVNPLLVLPDGAVAVDALIKMRTDHDIAHPHPIAAAACSKSPSTGPRPMPSTPPPAASWAISSPASATIRSCAWPSSPRPARNSSAPAGT